MMLGDMPVNGIEDYMVGLGKSTLKILPKWLSSAAPKH